MTHVSLVLDLGPSDPRRHPPGLDDDRGKTEDLYDPAEDEENPDPDAVSDDEEDIEDEEDEPSSNERK